MVLTGPLAPVFGYEIKLAKGIKNNSKQFYAYLRSKKKANPTVSRLKKPNGEFTTSVNYAPVN
jgi:hypothetical protein